MTRFLLLIAVFGLNMLLGGVALGQALPTYSYTPPAPALPGVNMNFLMANGGAVDMGDRAGAGSYQLPDGSWQSAKRMIFKNNELAVKDGPTGKQKFTTATIRQLEIQKDTFLVVNALPGRAVSVIRPEFVRSCVNRQGLRLLTYYYNRGQRAYFLSRPNQPLQLLPANKKVFRTTMAAIVHDDVALVYKISSGAVAPQQMEEIIGEYANYLRDQTAKSTP